MWSWIFGKKKENVAAPSLNSVSQRPADISKPNSALGIATMERDIVRGVKYDANLIVQLTGDHKLLLKAYGEMMSQAQAGRWIEAHATLHKFRVMLNSHLMLEGVKLHSYMSSQLQSDDDTAKVFQAYKAEMGAIGKVIFQFFDQHKDVGSLTTQESRVRFLATAEQLAAALTDRITREETQLYPLYQSV